ncbi:Chemotaxis protein methyltransferase CheR [hydrothermal vent metagenome]|uniref:protein-glutamate O-methyltransferase n=1 Tax=hydrothermal vent metagenome TaxID=652676 RepID=A0A3B0Y6K9_9ZZZZ
MTVSFSPDEYKKFQIFLEKACGIVLGENKHYLVSSRLNRLMQENNIASLQVLVDTLNKTSNSVLRTKVIEAMTTNETLWFRDTYPFTVLSQTIFEDYKQQKKTNLRIWSAACSSGQEPYSISMIADEYTRKNPGFKLDIIATDISQEILNEAKQAKYDALALARGLSEERKRQYFSPAGDQWQVNSGIRSRISFREINLLQSYTSLGKFDAIFCRNVLIYFSAESKKNILDRMANALNSRGFLMLGASESIAQYSDRFEMVRASTGVVYRLKPV